MGNVCTLSSGVLGSWCFPSRVNAVIRGLRVKPSSPCCNTYEALWLGHSRACHKPHAHDHVFGAAYLRYQRPGYGLDAVREAQEEPEIV